MQELHEKCAVFGIYGIDAAADFVHLGLWALQHRGQEGTGICSSDSKKLYTHKGNGLVADVFAKEILTKLKGTQAIGHNRYSTSGGSAHTQPIENKEFALVHNGNLPTTELLKRFLKSKDVSIAGKNDSELMHDAIAYHFSQRKPIEEAIELAFPLFSGAFSLLILTKDSLIALRDCCGIRPLSLGQKDGAYVFSSETCAFDIIGAEFIRDINPGEMVVMNTHGIHSYQLTKGEQKLDIFEFIYFARPDSILLGKSVNHVRKNLGRALAKEFHHKADVVIPVPDSAIPMALGFSEVSGIPFDHGIIKNRYIHRTFIEPSVEARIDKVKIKYNPIRETIEGKELIVIDDSIVRGTTSRTLIQTLRNYGAKKVYLLSACPPVCYPDFYGIDTPHQEELIAATKSLPDMITYIGADDIYYLSYEGLIAATELPEHVFCTSCFTGIYPIPIGKKEIVYSSVLNFNNKKKSKH